MFRKNEKSPDDFWREYEEKIGEKVLARSLGQYLSGWEAFDEKKWNEIWGLLIATSGGFHFHHFPHMGWLEAITHFTSGAEAPKEKTFFVPKEQLLSAALVKETKWWKKILSPSAPRLVIRYRNNAGEERELILETDYKSDDLMEALDKHARESNERREEP
ncbi:MAG: hypothetical protein LBS37_08265 [Treponema sp.]|jgi:hypothetical protein|nr:hypothetical protein [Treponema sp.]